MKGTKFDVSDYSTARARNYALLLTIVYSLNFIDRQILSILQESIKAELSLSDSELGLLSDSLSPEFGADSLTQAMLYLLPVIMFWAAYQFYAASRTLRQALKAAPV